MKHASMPLNLIVEDILSTDNFTKAVIALTVSGTYEQYLVDKIGRYLQLFPCAADDSACRPLAGC